MNIDNPDRRGFLKCMTWAGSAMVWTVAGGVPRAHLPDQQRIGLCRGHEFVSPRDRFSFAMRSISTFLL